MKQLIKSLEQITNERMRNPFISAFFISWIFINWKIIIYLLVSSATIESKIAHIETNWSSLNTILYLPIASTIFYTLILPHINLAIGKILQFSRNQNSLMMVANKKRNLEHQTDIAIAELKLEEAKKDYLESKSKNDLIDGLNKRIIELEGNLQIQAARSDSTIKSMNLQFDESRNEMEKILESANQRLKDALKQNNMLQKSLDDKNKELETKKQQLRQITEEAIKKMNSRIHIFDDGQTVIEHYDGSQLSYRDASSGQFYSEKEIQNKKKKHPSRTITL